MINVEEKKKKIISFLENVGPSIPVRIAKAIEMEPMFASAILSELLGSKEIITSSLRIGSSPLYLLPSQEKRLEEHIENLKPAEKEAYLKLKKETVLEDDAQTPAIRVALRSIKDFAKPFNFQEKLFWRYAFSEDKIVEEKLTPKKEEPFVEKKIIVEKKETHAEEKLQEVPKAWKVKKEEIKKSKEESKKIVEDVFGEEKEKPEFFNEVKRFLEKRKIEFLNEIQVEKKELVAKVNVKTELGNMNFLLIAKDKKSVTLDEIDSAIQRARHEKMPCMYLTKKEPPKKIQNALESNHLIRLISME